jgi:hypothetical protein
MGPATGAGGDTAEAWLEAGDSYAFTAAATVRAVEETLARSLAGAFSPAAAFGADIILAGGPHSIRFTLHNEHYRRLTWTAARPGSALSFGPARLKSRREIERRRRRRPSGLGHRRATPGSALGFPSNRQKRRRESWAEPPYLTQGQRHTVISSL